MPWSRINQFQKHECIGSWVLRKRVTRNKGVRAKGKKEEAASKSHRWQVLRNYIILFVFCHNKIYYCIYVSGCFNQGIRNKAEKFICSFFHSTLSNKLQSMCLLNRKVLFLVYSQQIFFCLKPWRFFFKAPMQWSNKMPGKTTAPQKTGTKAFLK